MQTHPVTRHLCWLREEEAGAEVWKERGEWRGGKGPERRHNAVESSPLRRGRLDSRLRSSRMAAAEGQLSTFSPGQGPQMWSAVWSTTLPPPQTGFQVLTKRRRR